jgi:hypothetical protein
MNAMRSFLSRGKCKGYGYKRMFICIWVRSLKLRTYIITAAFTLSLRITT